VAAHLYSAEVRAAATSGALRFSEWTGGGVLVALVCLLVLIAIVAVLLHRILSAKDGTDASDRSVARPTLALLLVGTLAILATASLTMSDKETRNILVGGIVSLSSAAVAFYFSSKGATEARRDLLKATSGVTVPELVGKTLSQAREIVSGTSLTLAKVDQEPGPDVVSTSQDPKAGQTLMPGSAISLTFPA
jgi:hypothetical protein